MGAKGEVSVKRIDIAVDCGPQVNPERIRSQMEGAVVMGMGLALSAEITFKDGRAQQNNFDGYEITRLDAAPKELHVHLIQNNDYSRPLGGVGEPGVPPVAPAIANAVFASLISPSWINLRAWESVTVSMVMNSSASRAVSPRASICNLDRLPE